MRVKSDVEYLRQIPLFANVDDTHLQVLSFSTKRKKVAKGRYLFKEGAKTAAAYLIIEGSVELLQDTEKSKELIAEAEAGAFLGEVAMIAGVPYSLSAKATNSVLALAISRDLFFRVAEEFPGFAERVMRVVNTKLESNLHDLKDVQDLLDRAPSWEAL